MKIRQIVADYAAKRRAVRELRSLDDRALNDLGLRREDINAVIWGR